HQTVLIYKDGTWYAGYAIESGDFVVPTGAIEVLRPGDTLLLDKSVHRIAIVIQIDANDYKIIIAGIFCGQLFYARQFFPAWRAPGCPEVDQNDLTAVFFERNLFA